MEKKKEDRMLEIMESLEKSEEIYKDNTKVVDKEKILKEETRIKTLATGELNSEFKNENYYVAGAFNTGGRGQTVNSIVDKYEQMNTLKSPKVEPSALKPAEALEVSIKRVLKSGTPINNISFYDEINWNLMNLGFPSVSEVDIKGALMTMIGE